MVTATSQGVKISIETAYQEQYSNPANEHFMFSYNIKIQNLTENAVQLLRRHWHIFDSNGDIREVDGDGVVGLQPVISPGDEYTYVSGCNLNSEMGSMKGHYTMIRLHDEQEFTVDIPAFELIVPYKLN